MKTNNENIMGILQETILEKEKERQKLLDTIKSQNKQIKEMDMLKEEFLMSELQVDDLLSGMIKIIDIIKSCHNQTLLVSDVNKIFIEIANIAIGSIGKANIPTLH